MPVLIMPIPFHLQLTGHAYIPIYTYICIDIDFQFSTYDVNSIFKKLYYTNIPRGNGFRENINKLLRWSMTHAFLLSVTDYEHSFGLRIEHLKKP